MCALKAINRDVSKIYNRGRDLFPWVCAAAAAHLVWQVRTADLDDPANLAERFRSNNQVGALVFASCVAGNLAMAPVLPA